MDKLIYCIVVAVVTGKRGIPREVDTQKMTMSTSNNYYF